MDRICRRSQASLGSVSVALDDVVLWALSSIDLQLELDQYAAECQVVRQKISTSKSVAIVLS